MTPGKEQRDRERNKETGKGTKRPGKEQRDLCWGDLELNVDAQGVRYVEFSTERQTKTRTGENPRNARETRPKMFENPDNIERCPVPVFLSHKDQRPSEMLNVNSPTRQLANVLSNKKQRQITAILCTAPASKENASQIMEIDEVCTTTAKAVQPASHAC